MVDDVVCLYQPANLMSVGYWYDDFAQVTDEQVIYFTNYLGKT
jgi:putative phosphoribosyl transferase